MEDSKQTALDNLTSAILNARYILIAEYVFGDSDKTAPEARAEVTRLLHAHLDEVLARPISTNDMLPLPAADSH